MGRMSMRTRLRALVAAVALGAVYPQAGDYDPLNPTSWDAVTADAAMDIRPPARNGHAAAFMDGKMWVVGGRTDAFQEYNMAFKSSRADVWYAEPPYTRWSQEFELTGDFDVQNWDALQPGPVAPWYSRHGHTLMTLPAANYGLPEDVMILVGGYAPDPKNDVWVTCDGRNWRFVGYAPFEPRAWHASVIFEDKLHVVGGIPMNNEMWRLDAIAVAGNITQPDSTWSMSWSAGVGGGDLWSPRGGHQVVTRAEYPEADPDVEAEGADSDADPIEVMYLLGGYAGWLPDHEDYDGQICRRDVYKYTTDGGWELVTAEAPWPARAWFGAAAWHHLDDRTLDANPYASEPSPARIWIMGGGFMGQSGNRRIDTMVGYVDGWWTRDGVEWTKVNFEEGADEALESSLEWAGTTVDDLPRYIGKWGHVLLQGTRTSDTDPDAEISALYILGGDTVADGSLVDDIFVTGNGIMCQADGLTCSGFGLCREDSGGCDCDSGISGEFCESGLGGARSAAPLVSPRAGLVLAGLLSLLLGAAYA